MLFTESKFLNCEVDSSARLSVLESLREESASPLIQAMRRRCYETALGEAEGGDEQLKLMERAVARLSEQEKGSPYVQGDLFCFEDHVLFLVFRDSTNGAARIQSGIVYTSETIQPLGKLDAFCREVRVHVKRALDISIDGAPKRAEELAGWRRGRSYDTSAFERFLAKQDIDFLYTAARREAAPGRSRAAELLEDAYTREFLRRTREAHVEGCATRLLKGEVSGEVGFSVERLSEAGLVLREVLISCRATGHALFRLPSADALAIITVSKAKCSECGALVADERVEDVIAPTELSAALLQDASWLVNRIYSMLRQLGVPPSEIVIAPADGHGEAHLMVNVCGEPFLFVLRDGDLTPALARRAIDAEIETGVSRLVVVATGKILEEARLFLREHARRRARGGTDVEIMIIEDVAAAAAELRRALDRFSRDLIAEQLCPLDDNLGFSASRLVLTRFELLQTATANKADAPSPTDAPPPPNINNVKYLPPVLDLTPPDASGVDDGRDLSLSM